MWSSTSPTPSTSTLPGWGWPCPNGTHDFLEIRVHCTDELARLYEMGVSTSVVASGEELWTLKKVLRRFIWHDRIHGKAIIRMQAKQKQLKLIDSYADPFHFLAASLKPATRNKARLIARDDNMPLE